MISPAIAITSTTPMQYQKPIYTQLGTLVHHHYTEFLDTAVTPASSWIKCPNLPDGWCILGPRVIDQFKNICHSDFTSWPPLCWAVDKPWWYGLMTERPAWWPAAVCLSSILLLIFFTLYARWLIRQDPEWAWWWRELDQEGKK